VLSSVLSAAHAPLTGTSRIELSMASCSDEDPASLRKIERRNEWFEVIERYEQPIQVLKFSSVRVTDGCTEGPGEVSVEVQVSRYPRDGGEVQTGPSVRIEGEDPQVLDQLDWPLVRVTQYGCCGAEDTYGWLDPDKGEIIAVSSTEPLPLQVINREMPQASLWRFAFGLSSVSAQAQQVTASGKHAIAQLLFLGKERPAQRYVVMFTPANEDEEGDWWFTQMAWSGPGLEEGNAQTWWLDGPAPVAAQVDGMRLDVSLQCRCAAPPLTLSIPISGDKLDIVHSRGHKSVRIKAI
jgi:hypothetical protein